MRWWLIGSGVLGMLAITGKVKASSIPTPLIIPTRPKTKTVMDNKINLLKDQRYTPARIRQLHPLIRQKVVDFIYAVEQELGIKIRIPSSGHLRTFPDQQRLYDQGRKNDLPRVTSAVPGKSYHNYGLAVDVVEVSPMYGYAKEGYPVSRWHDIGRIGKRYGFEWGGDWRSFKDYPHFQYTTGRSTRQLLALYNSNRTGNYVNIV